MAVRARSPAGSARGYLQNGQALLSRRTEGKIPEDDYRRVVLWLDSNSLRLGAFENVEKQVAGEVVWPTLDVDPANPQGWGVRARRRRVLASVERCGNASCLTVRALAAIFGTDARICGCSWGVRRQSRPQAT